MHKFFLIMSMLFLTNISHASEHSKEFWEELETNLYSQVQTGELSNESAKLIYDVIIDLDQISCIDDFTDEQIDAIIIYAALKNNVSLDNDNKFIRHATRAIYRLVRPSVAHAPTHDGRGNPTRIN